MPIMGPKPIPPEEEPEPSKSQYWSENFTTKWIKNFTQNFSSTNKLPDGEGGSGSSDHKKKGKKRGILGQVFWNKIRIGAKKLPYEEQRKINCRYFTLKEIEAATQNFSNANRIGEGGFGPVYKGVLPDKTVIAVKKLSQRSKQGSSEFLNEVNTISTLRHPNLVKLLGCCTEKNQLLLVYEYMENGSLQSALFGGHARNLKGRLQSLDWPSRVKICLGIAQGLAFLHVDDESKPKIIHRDIKPSNVLLDEYLNPKISDFGMARLYEEDDQSHVSTRIVGTMGYLAPEYAMRGILTDKADVYSFGLLTLELMSGKQRFHQNDEIIHVQDLAFQLQEKGDLLALIDEDLKTSIPVKEATMVLDLALLCASMYREKRPTMSEVVSTLKGRITMKTLNSVYMNGVDSKRATNDFPVNYLTSTSTAAKVTHPENGLLLPEDIYSASSSHVASKEEEDSTLTRFHGDFVYDINDPKGKGRDDGVSVLSSHVASREEEDSTVTRFQDDFVYDAKDTKAEEEQGDTYFSSHVTSKEEEDNTHTAFHGDFVPAVNDFMGEPRGDVKSLIHINAAISEPSILNARIWTSSTFEDVNREEDDDYLEYIEPSFEKGKLHINCLDEEFEVGCNRWKDSLVGYFLGEKESFNVDKRMVETLWELKGNISVFTLGSGYLLFQFNRLEDKIRILESSGLWHIEQKPLVLKKWNWKLKFDKIEMKSLPVWVKIYNLPLFLWSSSFFSKVGSGLGMPLYVDQKTKKGGRLDYARLCIEVDASKPFLESLDITVKGVDYQLNFEYEWGTLRCANCCTFGHIESKCRLKIIETQQN